MSNPFEQRPNETERWLNELKNFKPTADTDIFIFQDEVYALVPLKQTSEFGPDTHIGICALGQDGKPGINNENSVGRLFDKDLFKIFYPSVSRLRHDEYFTEESRNED